MPCRHYGEDREDANKRIKQLDRYAAMLCASCKLLTDDQIKQVPGLKAWWKQHQIDDAIAYEKKQKEDRHARRKAAALKKLTAEDCKTLGINCG